MRELITSLFLQFGLPADLATLVWAGLMFLLISIIGQVAVVFMVLMERKVLAWITQRKGPNRAGPFGVLQTVCDGVKLLFKEDIMMSHQDKFLFSLGPILFFAPSFVLYSLIPFTDKLLGLDLTVGLLFFFALSSLSVLGIVLAGWGSNNKYSLIGGMRSAAQAISYEIPLVMSALGVALAAGSMNLKTIIESQNAGGFGALSWYAVCILPVSFVIFWISSIAEVNRIPFDLPEAESELVSGYNTEYTGMKFALFFLAEYASLFAMSALMVVLFFGGYYSPIGGLVLERFGITYSPLLQAEMVTWMILKIYFFIFMAMLIRGSLPRLKPDQLMGFSWKFLIPLSVLNVLFIAFIKYAWISPTTWVVSIGAQQISLVYASVYALMGLSLLVTLIVFGLIFQRKPLTPVSQLKQRMV
jgi:NADH-quinone oxidoreductase subunit H